MRLLEKLSAREFSDYMRTNYDWFTIYRENECLGHAKTIVGYYVVSEENWERYRIVDFTESYPTKHAILYVE